MIMYGDKLRQLAPENRSKNKSLGQNSARGTISLSGNDVPDGGIHIVARLVLCIMQSTVDALDLLALGGFVVRALVMERHRRRRRGSGGHVLEAVTKSAAAPGIT